MHIIEHVYTYIYQLVHILYYYDMYLVHNILELWHTTSQYAYQLCILQSSSTLVLASTSQCYAYYAQYELVHKLCTSLVYELVCYSYSRQLVHTCSMSRLPLCHTKSSYSTQYEYHTMHSNDYDLLRHTTAFICTDHTLCSVRTFRLRFDETPKAPEDRGKGRKRELCQLIECQKAWEGCKYNFSSSSIHVEKTSCTQLDEREQIPGSVAAQQVASFRVGAEQEKQVCLLIKTLNQWRAAHIRLRINSAWRSPTSFCLGFVSQLENREVEQDIFGSPQSCVLLQPPIKELRK